MKKNLTFLFVLITLLSQVANSQNLIAVQNGNQPTFFTTLNSAVLNATDGDTVFLPSGSFTMPDSYIDKRLHFIGIGHNPSSSDDSTITIVNKLYLKAGADNGSIEGVYINGRVRFGFEDAETSIHGYTIYRCFILYDIDNYYFNNPEQSLTNISIIETSFSSIYGDYNTESIWIQNCIVRDGVWDMNLSIIQNCIFLVTDNGNSPMPIHNTHHCSFKNNIFYMSDSFNFYGQYNTFLNNLNWLDNIGNSTNYEIGNLYEDLEDIFVDFDTGNYHLKSTSVGKNAGTDGTDLGIYGGAFPWKDGAVPFNPHIQTFQISGTTDSTGSLNVNIEVAAQDH